MKLKEIAEKILVHLERFDKKKRKNKKSLEYYHPNVYQGGSKVMIVYVSYQITTSLSKKEAEWYLAWLDAGNVGKHHACREDTKFRDKRRRSKLECAGCGEALGTYNTATIRVGTRDDVTVCSRGRCIPKKPCAAKARAKLALCPGCDAEGATPGTLCWECRELIDRHQKSDVEPEGYLLHANLIGPYLSDDESRDLLMLLCRIAAPEGARRWERGGCPRWAGEVLGGDTGPFNTGHTGMPAVELDENQKEALLALSETIKKVMKAQHLEGVREGDSVLARMVRGEMSVSEINEYQVRKERLYGEDDA